MRWVGVGKMAGRSPEQHGLQWLWVDSISVLTRQRSNHMLDLEWKRGEDSEEENRGSARSLAQAQ
jgi:hypothetical protein